MDFKVGDENSDQKIKERNDKITWIIIIVISLIVGIGTFILTSSLLNQNEEIPIPQEEEPLDLSEQNVQILYKYVTYGIRNRRADKFLKESTTLATFTNQERFYYALQFASKNDFSSTGKNNAEGHPIYHITEAKIREYMQRFFGPGVSYTSQVKFPYTFRFTINGKNTGTFQTADGDGYNIVFDKVESNFQKDLVEPL